MSRLRRNEIVNVVAQSTNQPKHRQSQSSSSRQFPNVVGAKFATIDLKESALVGQDARREFAANESPIVYFDPNPNEVFVFYPSHIFRPRLLRIAVLDNREV